MEDPRVYFDLGAALSALGKPKGAVSALRGALRLLPDSDAVVSALAWELERMGLYNKALAVLRNHKKNNSPWHNRLYQQWGRIRGRQGKWRQAYVSYVRSVWLPKPDPDEPDSILERYDTITKMRRRAASMNPQDPESFLQLGEWLHDLNWLEEAANVMHTAALMRPSVRIYAAAASLQEAQWHTVDAIRTCKEGIQTLSGVVRPVDIAPLYEALFSTLMTHGYCKDALQVGAEATSLGALTPKLGGLYDVLQSDMERVENEDPIGWGSTAPPYRGDLLYPPE